MAARSPVSRRAARGLVLVLVLGSIAAGPAAGDEPARRPSTLVLASRTVAQDQGAWVIDYRLRHTGTDRRGRRAGGDRGEGRGLGVELAGGQPCGAAAVVAGDPARAGAHGRQRGDRGGRRGAPVPREADRHGLGRGPVCRGDDRGQKAPSRPRSIERAAGPLRPSDGRAAAEPGARRGGARAAAAGAPARPLRRLRPAAGGARRRDHPGRGDRPRPSSPWTASNTWRSRGSPGPSRPRSAATPGTRSRGPTACTSRPTSRAITITATPIGRSATARRCGCGSRT